MTKIFSKKGFRQFALRTALFFGILLALQLSIFLFFSKTYFFRKYLVIPTLFYFKLLQGLSKQDFINSAIFVIVAFLLWRRKEILNFKYHKQDKNQTIIFGILAFLVLVGHYFFKYWINLHINTVLQHVLLLTILKLGFNLLFIVALAFSIYNKNFIFYFAKRFYLDMGFFSIVLFLYYNLIGWFQDSWLFFSSAVGNTLKYVFSKIFDDVVFYISPKTGPVLGVGDFRVGISKVCSGIDSLLFFISLFAILTILNWKNLNKKRMAILLIPGMVGTFFLNIIRVFLIIVIAVKAPRDFILFRIFNLTPEQFAVDIFHTNAGWILFLVYFVAFWHFGSKWVLKK